MKWTVSEELILKRNYHDMTARELTKLLPKRTIEAIYRKASTMKLKKYSGEVSFIHGNGYRVIRCDEYPEDWAGAWRRNCKSIYVYEHCVQWWRHYPYDRIEKDDNIHHIDGNKTNNNIGNLVKMNRGKHSSLTFQERFGDMPGAEAMQPQDIF
jgi:hypothetical protein